MTTQIAPTSALERILGRPEHRINLSGALKALQGERILVTGARGSIGSDIASELILAGIDCTATDIGDMDVRDDASVNYAALERPYPTLFLHLAGAKHAPEGETDPAGTIETNITGTRNVLAAAKAVGARVVTASTCKACDPETVYGASKLLAERLTLDAGGTVARFYNVVESSGNVFRRWERLGQHESVPVTPCARYFITLAEATALVITAATLEPGRYAVNPGRRPRPMPSVAAALYPDRPQEFIPVRRGDRLTEPMVASCERVRPLNEWLWRVESTHDAPEANPA